MILVLLKIAHSIFGAISLYAGVVALSAIFAGRSFELSTIVFVRTALAASVTDLLFPFHGFALTHLAAMAAVYVAGAAALSWRRFHLNQVWGLIFVLSLIATLCLDVLVAIQHLFKYLSALDAVASGPAKTLFLIAESIVALFFTTVGILAVRRYWNRSIYSL